MVSSTHFGAPLFFMILIGLASGKLLIIGQSVLIIAVLASFILSCYRSQRKRDVYLFLIGGIILLLPVIEQCYWLKKFENESFFDDKFFAGSTAVFLSFLITTIISILKTHKDKSCNEDGEKIG